MTNNDNIIFFNNPKKIIEKLRKALKADENQANNLSIILETCIKENDYTMFYKYLYSEIEFRGGIPEFASKIKLQQIKLRNFLHSTTQPELSILAKILKGLGFSLRITAKV